MENLLPTIKVYDIDYSFIIKNYLNPKMWEKTWTLFQYKTFIVTLKIQSIYCQREQITFNIKLKDNSTENKYSYDWGINADKETSGDVYYSLKINDLNVLKKLIVSEVFSLIERLEKYSVIASDEYCELKEMYSNEYDTLKRIAEDFLDDNNVFNTDIRDAYIDSYISNNTKLEDYLSRMISDNQYLILPDLYLVFANATGNEKIISKWEYILSQGNDIDKLENEIKEYLEYMQSENFEEDMSDNLEEI